MDEKVDQYINNQKSVQKEILKKYPKKPKIKIEFVNSSQSK